MRISRRSFLKGLGVTLGGLTLQAPGYELVEAEGLQASQLEMEKRRLGRTELMVSAIGFGGGVIGDPRQVWVVQEAIRMGVNFIDTAHSYGAGRSERIIGAAIRGMRERVYIATKTAQRFAWGAAREILESLERLGIEQIDLLQLHAVGTFADLERALDSERGALRAVRELQVRGKVRFVGISGAHTPIDFRVPLPEERVREQFNVMVEAIKSGEFDAIQISYHIEWPKAEELIALAKEHDVGVIIKKPFAAGKLISEYGVKRLLESVLENPDVHTAIPGMARPEHVWEDVPVGYTGGGSDEN
jgi:aryl-alcohol dehydrogenase-like predicted oxidoreductase